ncbi:MAG: hypothetical protein WDN08_04640 [Rhizomicrobium sp.]
MSNARLPWMFVGLMSCGAAIVGVGGCHTDPTIPGSRVHTTGGEVNTVFRGMRILDGLGGPPIENGSLFVTGSLVRAIGLNGDLSIPDGTRVIDLPGKTIVPGLVSDTRTSAWSTVRPRARRTRRARTCSGSSRSGRPTA